MIAILKKELNIFLGSIIGYFAILVFLIVTGLSLWFFPNTSLLEYGYATLEGFFGIAPYILMFLIPALTMRSFAEEHYTGTIELLSTKPVKSIDIILGKYFAAFLLIVFSLIPTLIYYISVWQLGYPKGNIDSGGVWGSYLGLLFFASSFAAIGVFVSSLTSNQIIAFIGGVFLNYIMFLAFDELSKLGVFFGSFDGFVEQLGMNAHYSAMGRGVIDTRDVLYFLSLTVLFLAGTHFSLEKRKW